MSRDSDSRRLARPWSDEQTENTQLPTEAIPMPQNAARTRSAERITCSGCDATWTGTSKAHCSGCHRTYSSAGLFTAHRRDVRGVGVCMAPTPDMRLIDGVWRGPEFDRGALFGRAS